jgi:hypothetical protein
MRKQRPTIEWVVTESDAEWERLCADAVPTLPGDQHCRLRLTYTFLGIAALLLLLVGVIGVSRSTPDGPLVVQRSQTAILIERFPAVAEMNMAAPVSENGESPDYVFEVAQNVVVQNERKAVQVVMYEEHGEPVYRQLRFYQHIGPDWRQTEPVAALLGAPQQLATPRFVFYFRQYDAQTVATVAPQIETLYTTLQRNLGFPSAGAWKKLVIDIRVTMQPDDAPTQPHSFGHISVPSPALALAPSGLTDVQILRQSIGLRLVDHLLAQATLTYRLNSTWWPMHGGLRLWQLWDLDLPLADWREDVVKWLYNDAPITASAQVVRLPARYAALCTAHNLWMASPAQIGIPFWCHGLDQKETSILWWRQFVPPIHLAQLAVPRLPNRYQSLERATVLETYPGQPVGLATLIEYAVATYGRERLPVLVAGLGQYESWATLIPAVYGVSPAEFEAGWQRYLATHYSVSLESLTH